MRNYREFSYPAMRSVVKTIRALAVLSLVLAPLTSAGCGATPVEKSLPRGATNLVTTWNSPFVAYQPTADFVLPEIVLQYDPIKKTGANWDDVKSPKWYENSDAVMLGQSADYIRDGLNRMTGKEFPVVSKNDLSSGIILTLWKNAPEEIRNDREIQKALAEDPNDPYSAKEAFYIRSGANRVVVVANTPSGLAAAASALLESVDYEILGMGVDWIYAPDHRSKPLVFNVKSWSRPSFYIRKLWAHSGQSYGYGTIMTGLTDPADESVSTSYVRWLLGTRMLGSSMPDFPGHALQAYHKAVLDKMIELGNPHGFLSPNRVGLQADRPPASPEIKGVCWISTDPKGTPAYGKIEYCDGKQWLPGGLGSLDVSPEFVRQIIFEDMKKKSEAAFTAEPTELFIFPMDTEDGETAGALRDDNLADKNWYPDYLKREKLPFGRPYLLNGYKGINQPKEIWDPASPSDTEYGLAAYLLHEYDKWIDSLPKDQQVTAAGKSKKELVRCSLQSYNYHDVPPDFNPDPRTRASVAPFPKNRGIGKWEKLNNQEEVAKALHIMMPKEPSGNYSFYSFSYFNDGGPDGIPARWDASPLAMSNTYSHFYSAGFRSIVYEIDLNFAKNGLGYYLATKMLWDASLTPMQLDAIRDRWMHRAFGSAWKQAKAYYDFMLPANYGVNSPNSWGKAIRLLDAADKKLNGANEPDAQRRIDDLKQYWYVHYLFDTGKYAKDAPEVKEYLWKGQMSYMVGMQGLTGREYDRKPVKDIVGPVISAGPAHYTHEETQQWWPKVLETWPVTPMTSFASGTLADGKSAKTVDLNDLVMVKDFDMVPLDAPFLYNSGYMTPGTFLMVAAKKDDLLGFKLMWPFNPADPNYMAKKVPYGVEIWNPATKIWDPWIDQTTTSKQSVELSDKAGHTAQLVDVKLNAPRPGVYRFSLGFGGNLSNLASPTYDPLTGKYASRTGFTYFTTAPGLTQGGVCIYIPRGTKSLDLEVWDTSNYKFVTFYKGLPNKGLTVSRKVDISAIGAHVILLEPGEDGTVAVITGNNFNFPKLYSVPSLWAKSPAALLVPREIAKADGLTIMGATTDAAKDSTSDTKTAP